MRILAIDPGPTQSAFVEIRDDAIFDFHKRDNETILAMLGGSAADQCLIEKIEPMGMAVGAEVFETVFWSGRFAEAFGFDRVGRVTRRQVKLHLCRSMRAKDANIRQALIDRYGGTPAIKKGGPLYRVAGDVWSALAVAVTWIDTCQTSK